ncbi:MAG: ABC transporter permease [Treponema sp.]|jgi:simple sugar transport system permease protein|nr:ABC transporter permease [Treponema sp.]
MEKGRVNRFIIPHVVFVPVVGVLFLVLLVFLLNDSPLETLYFFFAGPFRNTFHFGNLLNAAVPLILGGLGVIIAFKAGCLNLGGEGQIYLGAFATTVVAHALKDFGPFGAVVSVFAGSLMSGMLAALSGFLKAKWNTNELITTFLLSCAVIPVINYFVAGPFLDPETSLISTKKIAEGMRLSLILKPSNLSSSFFIALCFVFIVSYFLKKTKLGYEFRMIGHNEMFARFGGINTKLNTVLALGFSGFMYGLAGSIVVLGTHHAVIKEFSAGLGWNGLTTALVAGFSPVAVMPAALFMAWINAGARIAMQNTGLSLEVASVVQAVILFLSTSVLLRGMFLRKGKT